VKKRTLVAAILGGSLCLFCRPAGTLDRQIVLGREDGWRDVEVAENLTLLSGRWGTLDYVLQDAEYEPTASTDLLIHFNALPSADLTGYYETFRGDLLLSEKVAVLGRASGGFSSGKAGLTLQPLPGALFRQGTWLQDFSIEFWLNPALLQDGEQIFCWKGARWNAQSVLPQEVLCVVQDRRVEWIFDNFFTTPAAGRSEFSFRGITALVPRDWHHHLLRYDSRIGLLEYLVDGVPEAILYTTDSGRETGTILLPFAGDAGPGTITIGGDFTGLIDELRISRTWVGMPSLTRYNGRTGSFQTRTFDLGYTGTRLKRIDAVIRTPGDSAVYLFYRMTDRADADLSGVSWTQVEPGQPLSDSRGRFLQVMAELFPDGTLRHSPEVSELRFLYEQDLPPAPPTGLHGIPGNGRVRLNWSTVNEEDVAGYLVYYGNAPGIYRGSGSDQGSSPIDVGNVSELEVTGLSNGRLYYFAVVAYDATDPPHRSLFSKEISARPSGLLP
jgi:hypothetical protein